jgi:surfactin family lipopeptide synthetase A
MAKERRIQDVYNLSPMQEGMLFHWLMNKESHAYIEQTVFSLKGDLDPVLLEKSFIALIERYDILRTVFRFEKVKQPVQFVLKTRNFKMGFRDISHLTDAEKETTIEQFIEDDKKRGFDLTRDMLMRVFLFRTGRETYRLLWNFHHTLMDGWCLGIIFSDLIRLYPGLKENRPVDLKPVTPYKNYIYWLEQQDKDAGSEYWRQYLENYRQQAVVPRSGKPGANHEYRPAEHQLVLDEPLMEGLAKLAIMNRTTMNALFQTFWGVLLQVYNNTDDVVFGSVVSGRPPEVPGIENMVGLFINTVPVRIRLTDLCTFSKLFKAVHRQGVLSRPYEYVPLSEIQSLSELKGHLIDHIMIFENYPLENEAKYAAGENKTGFQLEGVESFEQTNYDFNFAVVPGERLILKFVYNSSVYDDDFIKNIALHMKWLMGQVIEKPGLEVKNIEIITEKEKRLILETFNNTDAPYPSDKTIHRLFEEQVELVPDNIAVTGPAHHVTYEQLDRRSDQLACLLQEKGVTPGTVVGLMMERSLEMMTGIFGILKAGGAYLPIEPGYPEERINYMLADSSAGVLLSKVSEVSGNVEVIDLSNVINVDSYARQNPPTQLTQLTHPTHPGYVIYTSGSTGKPKGVVVEHHSVVNRLKWMQKAYPLNQRDRILQKTTITFDVSVWELFWWAFEGASLCLLEPGGEKNPAVLVDTIDREKVTVMHFVPSMLNIFLEYLEQRGISRRLASLKQVFASGEALKPQHAETFHSLLFKGNGTRLANLYGPTEATVDVSYFDCFQAGGFDPIPIGKPIDNTRLYILDHRGRLSLPGTAGELCIAGVGLARGYLNRPQLTYEKFFGGPGGGFSKKPPGRRRHYRTGDLARWLPDGNIEYLGRIDYQVKIRGFRIELGEIESRLLSQNSVTDAVVLARQYESGDFYLCAYVVSSRELTVELLKAHLARSLPDYMVPAYFVFLEQLPLTANHKVDRKALPEPEVAAGETYIAPRNEMEERLVHLWRTFFKAKKIGTKDNFFNIGGDSIKAIRLVSFMNAELNTQLEVPELYRARTIEQLALRMAQRKQEHKETAELNRVAMEFETLKARIMARENFPKEQDIEDLYPMSDIEKGMVFMSMVSPKEAVFHDQFVYQVKYKTFDPVLFRQAFALMVEKHPALRTGYNLGDYEESIRVEYRQVALNTAYEDISGLDKKEQEDHLRQYLTSSRENPFDVTAPPLWRLGIFLLTRGKNDHVAVAWEFHHAILDGWSNASLMTELNNTYLRLKSDPAFVPGTLKTGYKDFITRQVYARRQPGTRDFWKEELAGYKKLELTKKIGESANSDAGVEIFDYSLETSLPDRLKEVAKAHDTNIKHVCFAAYIYMIAMLSFDNDIVLGLVTSNRPALEDSDKVLGCYLNTIPVRMKLSTPMSWSDFIRGVDKKVMDLQPYDRLSLFEIARIIGEKADERIPIFDTGFSFIDFHIYEWAKVDASEADDANGNDQLTVSGYENTNTALGVSVGTTFGLLNVSFSFDPSLISRETIQKLSGFYNRVLDQFITEPGALMSKEAILSGEEKENILYRLNHTGDSNLEDGSRSKSIHQLFEEQVKKHPARPAVIFENKRHSCSEVEKRANQLAAMLKEKGVTHGTLVGIMVDTSLEMVAGLLGILKAGGAYLPIDPSYPEERLEYLLTDSHVTILLSKESRPGKWAEMVEVIDMNEAITTQPLNLPTTRPGHLAYVVYTSGTTGRPKGAAVEHRGIVNYTLWRLASYGYTETDVTLQLLSFCFDGFGSNFYSSLLSGGALVLVPDSKKLDMDYIKRVIKETGVTNTSLVPGIYEGLLDSVEQGDLDTFRLVVLAGEKAGAHLVEKTRVLNPGIRLVNEYGPTEASVTVTARPGIDPANTAVVGKPITNARVYVLDSHLDLLPLGVPGELCVAGIGLARGYLNRPELTKQKFCGGPGGGFSKEPPGRRRLYKTGDLGRWLPDGNLEILGRIDQQVKVRGYRVEPGEIEAQLLKHDAIKEVVVTTNGKSNLCAYFVSNGRTPGAEELRLFLSGRLPDYMVPSYFLAVEKILLTPHGKVDRRALPDPETREKSETRQPYIAPQTDVEKKIADAWQEVLSVKDVGINDNFFEIGGNSINVIMLRNKLKKVLGSDMPVATLFTYPTISDLAQHVREGHDHPVPAKKIDRSNVMAKGKNRLKHMRTRVKTDLRN